MKNLRTAQCCSNCKYCDAPEGYSPICRLVARPYSRENKEEFDTPAWQDWWQQYWRDVNRSSVSMHNVCDLWEESR